MGERPTQHHSYNAFMTDIATPSNFKFCPQCATALAWVSAEEDGGAKSRWRCTACSFVHWGNPTPVLAAIVEIKETGQILLARNAAWSGKFFALITGFMEAGESPQEGISREVKEETNLDVSELNLIGAYDFKRMNQVIIAYHVIASGEVVTTLDDHRLSIFGTHMYLLYLPSRHRTRAIKTCIDFLVEKANAN